MKEKTDGYRKRGTTVKIDFNAGGFGGSPFGAGGPFGGFDFGGASAPQEDYQPQKNEKKAAKPIQSPVRRTLTNLLVTVVFGLIYFYVVLPPINLKAP